MQRVRPAGFCNRDFFLLYVNAAAQNCKYLPIFDPQKLLQLFITPSPYSPDLSPPEYFLFPKLKMMLKGLHFADVAEIQTAVTDKLNKVQKGDISAAFQKV